MRQRLTEHYWNRTRPPVSVPMSAAIIAVSPAVLRPSSPLACRQRGQPATVHPSEGGAVNAIS